MPHAMLDWSALLEAVARAQHPVLLALNRPHLEGFYEFLRRSAAAGDFRAVIIGCSSASTGGICKDPAVIDTLLTRYLGSLPHLRAHPGANDHHELASALRLIALETILPPREASRALALAELLDEHPSRDCCAPIAEIITRGCSSDKVRGLVELEEATAEKCGGTTILVVEERRHAPLFLDERPPRTVRLLLYWGSAPPPSRPVNFVGPRDLARSLRGAARSAVDIGEGHVVVLEE